MPRHLPIDTGAACDDGSDLRVQNTLHAVEHRRELVPVHQGVPTPLTHPLEAAHGRGPATSPGWRGATLYLLAEEWRE